MSEDFSKNYRIDLRKIDDLVNPQRINIYASLGATNFVVNNEQWNISSIVKQVMKDNYTRFRSKHEFHDTDSPFFFHILLYYLGVISNAEVIPHLDHYYQSLSSAKQNQLKKIIDKEFGSIVKDVKEFGVSVFGKRELLDEWIEKKKEIHKKVEENIVTDLFNLSNGEIEVITNVLEKTTMIEGRESLERFLKNDLSHSICIRSSQLVIVDLFSRILFRGNENTAYKKAIAKALDKKIYYFKKSVYVPIEFRALLRCFTDSSRIPVKLDSRLLIKEFPDIGFKVPKKIN